jgi:hypothetical protein
MAIWNDITEANRMAGERAMLAREAAACALEIAEESRVMSRLAFEVSRGDESAAKSMWDELVQMNREAIYKSVQRRNYNGYNGLIGL